MTLEHEEVKQGKSKDGENGTGKASAVVEIH